MYGNWRINLFSGLAGFCFIFLIALSNNPIYISLFRAIYSFIIFFLIAYVMRFVIGTFIFPKDIVLSKVSEEEQQLVSGQNIDYVAHDENENIQELLKQQLVKQVPDTKQIAVGHDNNSEAEQQSFKPLKPTQLFSNKSVQPEEMSKAIRHLTGE